MTERETQGTVCAVTTILVVAIVGASGYISLGNVPFGERLLLYFLHSVYVLQPGTSGTIVVQCSNVAINKGRSRPEGRPTSPRMKHSAKAPE